MSKSPLPGMLCKCTNKCLDRNIYTYIDILKFIVSPSRVAGSKAFLRISMYFPIPVQVLTHLTLYTSSPTLFAFLFFGNMKISLNFGRNKKQSIQI